MKFNNSPQSFPFKFFIELLWWLPSSKLPLKSNQLCNFLSSLFFCERWVEMRWNEICTRQTVQGGNNCQIMKIKSERVKNVHRVCFWAFINLIPPHHHHFTFHTASVFASAFSVDYIAMIMFQMLKVEAYDFSNTLDFFFRASIHLDDEDTTSSRIQHQVSFEQSDQPKGL